MSREYPQFPIHVPQMGIYAIICAVDNRVYVGQSRRIRGRWKDHVHYLRAGKGSPKLQKAWDTHGWQAFRFEVLEVVKDPMILQEREQFHIDRLGAFGVRGLNTLPVAGSFDGYTPDEGARKKIGDASKKRWSDPNFRKKMAASQARATHPKRGPLSPKVLQALIAANTGKKASAETRAKMSAAKIGRPPLAAIAFNTGKPRSEEVKQKISDAKRGKKLTKEQLDRRNSRKQVVP